MKIVRSTLATLALLAFATSVAAGRVDFKNFIYPWTDPDSVPSIWHWMDEPMTSRVRVVNGIHRFYEPGETDFDRDRAPYLEVRAIVRGDLDDDGVDDAVVELTYGTGGTASWDYLYVYKLGAGVPKLLARMETGSRGSGGLLKAAVRNGQLVVEFADPARRAGDCCSRGFIRVRYRWKKEQFVEEGVRETGDLPLIEHLTEDVHQ